MPYPIQNKKLMLFYKCVENKVLFMRCSRLISAPIRHRPRSLVYGADTIQRAPFPLSPPDTYNRRGVCNLSRYAERKIK